MNRKHTNKIIIIISFILILSIAVGLILYALKQNINLFYTPTQLLTTPINKEHSLRLGGYVKKGSIHYDPAGKEVLFIITDHQHDISVTFSGVLPNLFREEQGVVVTGKLTAANTLIASEVLAKHDEKYMPWPLKKAEARNVT